MIVNHFLLGNNYANLRFIWIGSNYRNWWMSL